MSSNNALKKSPVARDGKRPLSEKQPPGTYFSLTGGGRNRLDIPQSLKKEFEEKNLEYRWIDAKKYADNSNMHDKYWEVYKRDSSTIKDESVSIGLPADGTVRRGTLVLAVRPKFIGDEHRKHLRNRVSLQQGGSARSAQELREMARSHGVDTSVDDEYGSED